MLNRIGIVIKDGKVVKIDTNIDNLDIVVIDLDVDSYYESELRDRRLIKQEVNSLAKLRAIM